MLDDNGPEVVADEDQGRAVHDAWMSAMRRGDFETAWRVSDAVLQARLAGPAQPDDLPLHLRAVWDGSPLEGRHVLVRCYHGLGDAIQFLRLVKPLSRRARAVTAEVPPELLGLLRSLEGIDQLVALGADPGSFDVAVEAQELPHALRLQPSDLPGPIPYLGSRPTALSQVSRPAPARTDGRLRVGVVWTAGAWHPARSLPLAALRPLAEVPGLQLFSLQQGPGARDIDAVPWFRDLSTADVQELAATLSGLDLVISVDTMVAHLAGALGRPIWTLLHEPADWRWMDGREDSPWYPTMRLYRQRRAWRLGGSAFPLAKRSANTGPARRRRSVMRSVLAAALLAATAGLVDAVGWLALGHVFVANQTGNAVLFGIDLGTADPAAALRRGMPIVAFFGGVLLSRLWHERAGENASGLITAGPLILIEFVGLAATPMLAGTAGDLIIPFLGLIAGLQNGAATRFGALSLNTVVLTGLLEKIGETAAQRLVRRRSQTGSRTPMLPMAGAFLAYVGGAALGGILTPRMGLFALWTACPLLLCSLPLLGVRQPDLRQIST